MKRSRWIAFCLAGCLLLIFSACANTNDSTQMSSADTDNTQVQYDYQLKAGELIEVYDVTFDEMVTITIDPDSTRNGDLDLRSNISFDNCTFNGGVTVKGDYHAMISFGSGCVFQDDSVITCEAADLDAVKEIVLEDNFVKIFVACEGVAVETESAIGVVSVGPDFILNGSTYSKAEIAPDIDFLGVYSIYEGDTITYMKLAIGEDNSVAILD